MLIKKSDIIKHGPCPNGLKWLNDNFSSEEITLHALVNKLHVENRTDWCDWVLNRFTPDNWSVFTYVRVEDCPGLTALPELPLATDVWVMGCPGLDK